MKVGDLVQVLPARMGHYIIVAEADLPHDPVAPTRYWQLLPLPGAGHEFGGAMSENFIEVVSALDSHDSVPIVYSDTKHAHITIGE